MATMNPTGSLRRTADGTPGRQPYLPPGNGPCAVLDIRGALTRSGTGAGKIGRALAARAARSRSALSDGPGLAWKAENRCLRNGRQARRYAVGLGIPEPAVWDGHGCGRRCERTGFGYGTGRAVCIRTPRGHARWRTRRRRGLPLRPLPPQMRLPPQIRQRLPSRRLVQQESPVRPTIRPLEASLLVNRAGQRK